MRNVPEFKDVIMDEASYMKYLDDFKGTPEGKKPHFQLKHLAY